MRSVVVYRDELVFVVPPSHPLARRAEVSIAMLGNESFVAHHVASPYRARVLDAFRKHRVTLHMPVEMPTIDAIKRFVAMGHGVALLPGITVEAELRRGELVRVPVPELALERNCAWCCAATASYPMPCRRFWPSSRPTPLARRGCSTSPGMSTPPKPGRRVWRVRTGRCPVGSRMFARQGPPSGGIMKHTNVSRRRFVGGLAATLGYVGTRPGADLWAQGGPAAVAAQRARGPMSAADYDQMVKLANNENNWGPPESVMKAMNNAWKYVEPLRLSRRQHRRRRSPSTTASSPRTSCSTAGSGEMLDVVGTTFLLGGKKVVGVEPSYGSVYQHATSIKADARSSCR